MRKKALPIAAVVVLIIALCFSFYMGHQEKLALNDYYNDFLPSDVTTEAIADNAVKMLDKSGATVGYAGLDKYIGFGGPLLVGIITDTEGIMTDLKILEHKETPQYLVRIADEGYFKQYENRDIKQSMIFGQDIDGIAAATLSTRAIAMSADSVAESIRVNGLGLPPSTASIPWQIGLAEILVAALIAATFVLASVPKLRKFRPILLIISVASLGFWLNRPATMAQVSGLFMGYLPVLKTNLIWYMVMAVALIPPVFLGKNYYCTYLCPFGAAQEGIHFVAKKAELPQGKKMAFLHQTRNLIVFVALLVAFLFQNPSVSSFEPFAALFNFEATGIQFILVGTVLVAAIFFRKLWCAGFCPVGGFLDLIAKFRRSLGRKLKKSAPLKAAPAPSCPHAAACAAEQAPTKKEKLADGLFKLFYALMIFTVIAAIFEKWSLM